MASPTGRPAYEYESGERADMLRIIQPVHKHSQAHTEYHERPPDMQKTGAPCDRTKWPICSAIAWKNKTTKTCFVVEIHFCNGLKTIYITLFLLGGLFRLLCRGLLRRHVVFTPFHQWNRGFVKSYVNANGSTVIFVKYAGGFHAPGGPTPGTSV